MKLAGRRARRLLVLLALGSTIFQLTGCIATVLLLQLADLGLRGLFILLVGEPIE